MSTSLETFQPQWPRSPCSQQAALRANLDATLSGDQIDFFRQINVLLLDKRMKALPSHTGLEVAWAGLKESVVRFINDVDTVIEKEATGL